MFLKIYPENPNEKHVRQVADCLRRGGVVIIPTDTVYAIACDSSQIKAAERVSRIKGTQLEKANFSFLCHDLSHISDYAKHIDNPTFKIMKSVLPGPFTFILSAGNKVSSRYFGERTRKKTIGIRVPDNPIARAVIAELGNPLMSTSLHDEDEILDYITNPELIFEKYRDMVDVVVDGGYGGNEPSTVIDCTGEEPVLVRQGKGILF
jgi:tRNA threonylcarbamoyl adenosine modification protein (Sua5/YciO/YrdC/YwlC family)